MARTQTETQKLATWLRSTLETRGTDAPNLEHAQLMVVHGHGDTSGTVRWPLKTARYYSEEKAEDFAAEVIAAAQDQADGLACDTSTFVALFEAGRPLSIAEQSLPWRTTTAAAVDDKFPANERGVIAILQKLVLEQGKQITHVLPTITREAIAFAQVQNERNMDMQRREEEARITREHALSGSHAREMERIELESRLENRRSFLKLLGPMAPMMQKALVSKFGPAALMAPKPAAAAVTPATPATPGEQPAEQSEAVAALAAFMASLSEEQQERLPAVLAAELEMAQMQNLARAMGLDG